MQLFIGDLAIPLTSQSGHLKPKFVTGRAYVLGVHEKKFVEAIAVAPKLEVRHRGVSVAQYRISDNAKLASLLSACLAKS